MYRAAPGGDPTPATTRASRRRLARAVAVAAVLLAALLAFGALIPGSIGTGFATILPWLGLLIPVLFVTAVISRRRRAWLIVAVPLIVWAVAFVPSLVPLGWISSAAASDNSLTVASQNVQAGSGTAAMSATTLADEGADVIALEELDADARVAAASALEDSHPYSYTVGTVGLWSTYPIVNEQPLDLGLGWKRALAADIDTPAGLVSVYVIHAASFRPGEQTDRDTMLAELAAMVPNDENDRMIVLGDFNATSTDQALAPLQAELSEPNQSDASLGFTWPANFPIGRIDHIFQRGLDATSLRTFESGSSDHLAVLATFNL